MERRDTSLDDRLAQLATVAGIAGGELGDVCDQILGGLLGGKRPSDDVALLALRPEPPTAGSLELRLPAEPAALAQLRQRIGRFLDTSGADERARFEITLAVSEAAMNAIEHAYGPRGRVRPERHHPLRRLRGRGERQRQLARPPRRRPRTRIGDYRGPDG